MKRKILHGAENLKEQFFTLHLPRVGPSASQAPKEEMPSSDQLAEVVQALSLLQNVMTQPWARKLVENMSAPSSERAAERGEPASSRPAPHPPQVMPESPSEEFDAEEHKPLAAVAKAIADEAAKQVEPSPAPTAVGSDASTPSPAVPEVVPETAINSNTHRASRARLARRMQALAETPAECPQMQKLWAGTRKDCRPNCKCFFAIHIQ